jgi:hypothetical protein
MQGLGMKPQPQALHIYAAHGGGGEVLTFSKTICPYFVFPPTMCSQ